jgi:Na+-translocating membrane potential-generating system (MpsC)
VRTYWCGGDVITTVLEETLTPAERNLVVLGEHQRQRDTRMFFQYATVRDFCGAVERHTGRTVKAFVSGMDTAVDGLAVETFILHPPGSQAPSRAKDEI